MEASSNELGQRREQALKDEGLREGKKHSKLRPGGDLSLAGRERGQFARALEPISQWHGQDPRQMEPPRTVRSHHGRPDWVDPEETHEPQGIQRQPG
jgi:hypothetical protein